MMSHLDYPSITKVEKSHYNEIKKNIFDVSQKLGYGSIGPVPYDTAFVARIPKTCDLSSPAFPDSLQWLRDHQQEDGSWGAESSSFLHSKILNTFASVLALAQWNFPEDEIRKKKGLQTLTVMMERLHRRDTIEMTFEMIVSGLMEDAYELKIDILDESFECHSKIGKQKLIDMKCEFLSITPNKYWSILEATAGTLSLHFDLYRSEITRYGLIAAQPSTTAFILRCVRLQGDNFPEAEWALKKLCIQNKGGMPHFSPCDNFETIYGLDLLFKANINPRINVKYATVQKALDKLGETFDRKIGIGFSSSRQIPDEGCSKTALRILSQSSYTKKDIEDDKKMDEQETPLKTKPKTHLDAESLKRLEYPLETDNTCKFSVNSKDINNLGYLSYVRAPCLGSIRNLSIYFNMLEKLLSLEEHDINNAIEIAHFIGESQNNDGGWGTQGISTVEETAYVCLAISHLAQKGSIIVDYIKFPKLVDFINQGTVFQNNECFWCYKVNFFSSVISEVALICAKNTIFQLQRLFIMTDAFHHYRLDFMDVEFFDENAQNLFWGKILLTCPEVDRLKIVVNRQEVLNSCKDICQVDVFDNHVQSYIEQVMELSNFHYTEFVPPHIRAFDTMLIVILLLIDDIFDLHFSDGKHNFEQGSDAFITVLVKILRGDYRDFEAVPMMNLPRFSILARWSYNCKNMMEERKWKIEPFLKVFEKAARALGHKMHIGTETSPKVYLKNGKIDVALLMVTHSRNLLEDIDSSEFENCEMFVKYQDHACKACRLLNDIPTVLKDVSLSIPENYCLKLQNEYKISLQEALIKATKKANKEILKMFSCKKMILKDPEYRNNQQLSVCMKNVEGCVDGLFIFSMTSLFYLPRWKTSAERVYHKKQDPKFVWDLCFT